MSASETPVLVTSMVKVWLAPPAVTGRRSKVLVDGEVDVLDDVDRVAAGGRAASSASAEAVLPTARAASVAVSTL